MKTLAHVLLLCATALLGCERAQEPESKTGTRVVALTPAAAVTMTDLGIADLIVGRHGWDMVLDPAIPVCGDQAGLDYERLVSVDPTHVVIQWGEREAPARLMELSAQLGWEVIDLPLLTLDEVRASIETLGSLNDRAETDGLIARWDAAIAPQADVFSGGVLLLGSVDPPAALGPGSFHHQLLVRLGGTPAVTDGAPWIEMDAEDVRTLDPEAVLLVLPGREGPAIDQLGSLASLDLRAARDERVGLVSGELAHIPASSLIGVGEEMAAALRGFRAAERAAP